MLVRALKESSVVNVLLAHMEALTALDVSANLSAESQKFGAVTDQHLAYAHRLERAQLQSKLEKKKTRERRKAEAFRPCLRTPTSEAIGYDSCY